MPDDNPNPLWARTLVDALAKSGVQHVCLSPGARSAPLALAFAEHGGLTTSVHVDERSSAYFALGRAAATGVPSAVVCTSGTAAANLLPAVIEAHYSRVPLIVITADRPPEHRDTGAWQTINQTRLYGVYPRWFVDLPTPSSEPQMLRYVRNVAARAVAVSRTRPAGPVHLNVPFREPLAPVAVGAKAGEVLTTTSVAAPTAAGPEVGSILSGPPSGGTRALPAVLDELASTIAAEPRGLILAGRTTVPEGYADAIAQLAEVSGYPVLAEPAGGLRFGAHDRSHVVTGYDAFLRSETWMHDHVPGFVLRFGSSFTWRQVAEFLGRSTATVQVIVDPGYTWDDPTRSARRRMHVDPVPLCAALTERLGGGGLPDRTADAWSSDWREACDRASDLRAHLVDQSGEGTVAWVYPTLIDTLPDGALIYAANSMAVRDLDTFTVSTGKPLHVLANRGAAGIDGTISSALGAAHGSRRPTVLASGDVSFAHDLNGLAAARLPGLDVTILVLNDGGGGIFEYLPISGVDPATFERYFLTPPALDIGAACRAYGLPHTVAEDAEDLASLVGPGQTGVRVVEVPVDRSANTAFHRRYWGQVSVSLTGD